jgi:hypothetical protein
VSDALDALIDEHLNAPADPLDALIDEHLASAAPVRPNLDIGPLATGAVHGARHLSFGLGDKVIAGIHALNDYAHDKTGKVTLADAYKRDLAFNDKVMDASDEANPKARWAGNLAGVAGSLAVPLGVARLLRPAAAAPVVAQGLRQLVRAGAAQGAKTGAVMGTLGGFGNSRADGVGGQLEDTVLGAGTGLVGGAGLGALAPVAGRLVSGLGDKAKDAAGWLKVNSLHPTPTLGEAMEELPGGRIGVGRELLRRNIGGLTKHGTAEQLSRATKGASSAIDAVAAAHDASGGAPVNLVDPIEASLAHAAELNADPTTRAAGQRLASDAGEYRDTYAAPATATEALKLKRILGDAAYSQSKHFAQSGEPVAGQYGKGLGKLERGVDSAMDSTLGPEFEARNLEFRRLLSAKEAAERSASRTHSNHVLGLIPMALGAGGYAAHGAEGGAAAALGSLLLGKYGSQAGARGLYTLGNALESEGLGRVAQSPVSYTRALIEALRRGPTPAPMSPVSTPMLAQQEDSP